MIGLKAGTPGAKRSRGQSTKRKRASTPDRGGVAGVSGSGDGGSGVSGESAGVGDVKFFGVRVSASIVEIKNYAGKRGLYLTVKGGPLRAAIVHDIARLWKDPNYPEKCLNFPEVERRIKKEAQIMHSPIGETLVGESSKKENSVLEFMKLKGWTDKPFPLESKD